MTDAAALFILAAMAVLITQLWLFLNGLRQAAESWIYEWLQWREWDARSRAAVAARKAQELARWKDEQGHAYAFDFDSGQVRALVPDKPRLDVPNARKWQIALTFACGWGELVGWTERAWRDNGVVYLPETGQHYETGRREIVRWLDKLGITANGVGGRTWADGMSYGAAIALLDTTPPRPEWAESPPPSVRLPHEGANPRTHEPKAQSTALEHAAMFHVEQETK